MKACYLCGGIADTRDHLPPKSFFPKPAPVNLITVPCCTSCNNQLSTLDETFRVFASTEENRSQAGRRILQEKVFSPNSVKGSAFREIAKTLRDVEISIGGRKETKHKLSLDFGKAKDFLVRLTKGFIFKFYPDLHSRTGYFHVEYLSDPNETNPMIEHVKSRISAMQMQDIGRDVFTFWRDADGPGSIWIFRFYGAATFLVSHSTVPHPLFEE